jgi:hypothetical protein
MDIRTILLTSIVEYENVFYTCMYATASSITPLVATYSYVNQNNETIVDKVWSDKHIGLK